METLKRSTLKLSRFHIRSDTGVKKAHASKPTYSRLFAFVYILNLIVGVGAIAMPKAFAMAGWLLGLFLLIVLAMLSYMTATYVIEAMATANAYGNLKKTEKEGAYTYAVVIPRSIQSNDKVIPEESVVHVSNSL